MRRGKPAAVSYHYKPAKAGEMGEIMLYRVYCIMGCGYTEISRRKSLEKAISDAAKAVEVHLLHLIGISLRYFMFPMYWQESRPPALS